MFIINFFILGLIYFEIKMNKTNDKELLNKINSIFEVAILRIEAQIDASNRKRINYEKDYVRNARAVARGGLRNSEKAKRKQG